MFLVDGYIVYLFSVCSIENRLCFRLGDYFLLLVGGKICGE